MVQKYISVAAIYNNKQALFSIPRLMFGNFINFFATWRAAKMYLANRLFGTPIVWLKTMHVFPGEAELSEYKRSIEDLLVAEGLVTRDQIVQALETQKDVSVPLALLRLGLIDEKQFTDIWSKYSHLPVKAVNPSEVPGNLLLQFSEKQSAALEIIPVSQHNGTVLLALREPPANGQLDQLRARFGGQTIEAVLARPENIKFVRNRVYPRLVLPPSRMEAALGRFQEAAQAEPASFLEALINQHATRRSLPDVLVDLALLDPATSRKLWAEVLGCPPWETKEFKLDRDAYRKFGVGYWWLHRMLPAGNGRALTAAVPHPQSAQWLNAKLGPTALAAELPDKLELAARVSGIELDSDQALVDRLVTNGALAKNAAPDVKIFRELIADPIPKWLLMQNMVTEEQLHQAFLEVANLPVAETWQEAEVRRLLPILPPGFAVENHCYPLQESNGALRIGLAQMPSAQVLQEIYDRLAGYPICFQALTMADAAKLRSLAAAA
ncbi:MAG: hypothetical protein NTZ16_10840 [Verrucomicrobia bacterium]|nr:hypothetical protein [Verrucomicrobiota bacterium]